MNKEEKDAIDFLRVSAITKIEKTILSKEDVKYLLNYIDKLQKENEQLKEENFNQVYMKAIADYKEKIRNKISQIDEEYSKTLEKELSLEFHNINAQRHEAMKMVLEELLGE